MENNKEIILNEEEIKLFSSSMDRDEDLLKVKALLDRGYKDAKTTGGETPAMLAKSAKITSMLRDAGDKFDAIDSQGGTALHYYNKTSEQRKIMVETNPSLVNKKTIDGYTPLMSDCLTAEDVNLYIKNGADPNATDNNGMTAFMHIMRRTSILEGTDYSKTSNPIRAALEGGARWNAVDKNGNQAWQYARSPESVREVETFLIKKSIKDGKDVNKSLDENGTKPAMLAHNAEQAKLYLDAGADKNATDKQGKTLLMYAAQQNNGRLVSFYLRDVGLNPLAKDKNGKTAADYTTNYALADFIKDHQKKAVAEMNMKKNMQKTH